MPPRKQEIAFLTYHVELSDARHKIAMKTDEMSYREAKAIYDKLHPGKDCRLYLKENAYDRYDNIVAAGENMCYKDGE